MEAISQKGFWRIFSLNPLYHRHNPTHTRTLTHTCTSTRTRTHVQACTSIRAVPQNSPENPTKHFRRKISLATIGEDVFEGISFPSSFFTWNFINLDDIRCLNCDMSFRYCASVCLLRLVCVCACFVANNWHGLGFNQFCFITKMRPLKAETYPSRRHFTWVNHSILAHPLR